MRIFLRSQLFLMLAKKVAADLAQRFSRQPPYRRTLIFHRDPFEEWRRFAISNLAQRKYRSPAPAFVFWLRQKMHDGQRALRVAIRPSSATR
jgi:hypothetical protein